MYTFTHTTHSPVVFFFSQQKLHSFQSFLICNKSFALFQTFVHFVYIFPTPPFLVFKMDCLKCGDFVSYLSVSILSVCVIHYYLPPFPARVELFFFYRLLCIFYLNGKTVFVCGACQNPYGLFVATWDGIVRSLSLFYSCVTHVGGEARRYVCPYLTASREGLWLWVRRGGGDSRDGMLSEGLMGEGCGYRHLQEDHRSEGRVMVLFVGKLNAPFSCCETLGRRQYRGASRVMKGKGYVFGDQ